MIESRNTKKVENTRASKISKSEVMSRAWRIYRSKWNKASLSECLCRAWRVEKENVVYRAERTEIESWINRPRVKVEFTAEQESAFYLAKVNHLTSYYE
jgi:hypothetical protein